MNEITECTTKCRSELLTRMANRGLSQKDVAAILGYEDARHSEG